MSELNYKQVMRDLVKNPSGDSIKKIEALLVNKSTRVDDVNKNIKDHEKFVESHETTLSGDFDITSVSSDSNQSQTKSLEDQSPVWTFLLSGFAIGIVYYLVSKK